MPDFLVLSKLKIKNGAIHYKIYAQDGRAVPMTCLDTPSNRLFVAWVQRFDRHEKSWINQPWPLRKLIQLRMWFAKRFKWSA